MGSRGLAALIRCTGRWAEVLTQEARDAAKAERDAAIVAAAEAGEPVELTAERLGVSARTVKRVRAEGPETNPSQMAPPTIAELWQAEQRRAAIRADLADMESPKAQRWHGALRALREINEQAPVTEMFAERHRRVDHAIGPELERAHAWINDLHRRFFDE